MNCFDDNVSNPKRTPCATSAPKIGSEQMDARKNMRTEEASDKAGNVQEMMAEIAI